MEESNRELVPAFFFLSGVFNFVAFPSLSEMMHWHG